MRPALPALALGALLGGCAVYPDDGTIGPLPPAGAVVQPAPPVAYAPAYAPPSYAYGSPDGVPVYVAPPPPPVVVSPSISLGFGWGWGYGWGGRGYWGRPYYGHRHW